MSTKIYCIIVSLLKVSTLKAVIYLEV